MLRDFLFAQGHAVDLVLLVIVAEFVFLTTRRRRFGHQASPTDRVLAFAPGVCLLLALRAALTGAGWVWVAFALAASFPFHIADLIRRRL
jgi:hypothetical protein